MALPEAPQPLWERHRLLPLALAEDGARAFDGAEGYGAWTAGGRGGKIVAV